MHAQYSSSDDYGGGGARRGTGSSATLSPSPSRSFVPPSTPAPHHAFRRFNLSGKNGTGDGGNVQGSRNNTLDDEVGAAATDAGQYAGDHQGSSTGPSPSPPVGTIAAGAFRKGKEYLSPYPPQPSSSTSVRDAYDAYPLGEDPPPHALQEQQAVFFQPGTRSALRANTGPTTPASSSSMNGGTMGGTGYFPSSHDSLRGPRTHNASTEVSAGAALNARTKGHVGGKYALDRGYTGDEAETGERGWSGAQGSAYNVPGYTRKTLQDLELDAMRAAQEEEAAEADAEDDARRTWALAHGTSDASASHRNRSRHRHRSSSSGGSTGSDGEDGDDASHGSARGPGHRRGKKSRSTTGAAMAELDALYTTQATTPPSGSGRRSAAAVAGAQRARRSSVPSAGAPGAGHGSRAHQLHGLDEFDASAAWFTGGDPERAVGRSGTVGRRRRWRSAPGSTTTPRPVAEIRSLGAYLSPQQTARYNAFLQEQDVRSLSSSPAVASATAAAAAKIKVAELMQFWLTSSGVRSKVDQLIRATLAEAGLTKEALNDPSIPVTASGREREAGTRGKPSTATTTASPGLAEAASSDHLKSIDPRGLPIAAVSSPPSTTVGAVKQAWDLDPAPTATSPTTAITTTGSVSSLAETNTAAHHTVSAPAMADAASSSPSSEAKPEQDPPISPTERRPTRRLSQQSDEEKKASTQTTRKESSSSVDPRAPENQKDQRTARQPGNESDSRRTSEKTLEPTPGHAAEAKEGATLQPTASEPTFNRAASTEPGITADKPQTTASTKASNPTPQATAPDGTRGRERGQSTVADENTGEPNRPVVTAHTPTREVVAPLPSRSPLASRNINDGSHLATSARATPLSKQAATEASMSSAAATTMSGTASTTSKGANYAEIPRFYFPLGRPTTKEKVLSGPLARRMIENPHLKIAKGVTLPGKVLDENEVGSHGSRSTAGSSTSTASPDASATLDVTTPKKKTNTSATGSPTTPGSPSTAEKSDAASAADDESGEAEGGKLTPMSTLRALDDKHVRAYIQKEFGKLPPPPKFNPHLNHRVRVLTSGSLSSLFGSNSSSSGGNRLRGGSAGPTGNPAAVYAKQEAAYRAHLVQCMQRICLHCFGVPRYMAFVLMRLFALEAAVNTASSTGSGEGNAPTPRGGRGRPGSGASTSAASHHTPLTTQQVYDFYEAYLKGKDSLRRVFDILILSSQLGTVTASGAASASLFQTSPPQQQQQGTGSGSSAMGTPTQQHLGTNGSTHGAVPELFTEEANFTFQSAVPTVTPTHGRSSTNTSANASATAANMNGVRPFSPFSLSAPPALPLRSYLLPEDFTAYVNVILQQHPGLSFLKQTPDFQAKYLDTVIYRIFYELDRFDRGVIRFHEFTASRLMDALRQVDATDDINTVLLFFSYEHFYVLYCRFWELDEDRDMMLSRQDLALYQPEDIMNPLIIDRVFRGIGRPVRCPVRNKIGYEDFVWYCLSEEDKSTPRAIRYFFRILDLDGDGVLSLFELQTFYDATRDKIAEYVVDGGISFDDVACQVFDMLRCDPRQGITLADLLREPEAAAVALNMLTNVIHFLQYEQRDPFVAHQDRLIGGIEQSAWDRFARMEYDRMAKEVDA